MTRPPSVALALAPMLSADVAQLLWGFNDVGGPYRFAMGVGASPHGAWLRRGTDKVVTRN